MVKGFGMGHQAENPAAGVTDSGNIINGTVGIEREIPDLRDLPSGMAYRATTCFSSIKRRIVDSSA